ncbi:lipopolysaccharide biosynthesis protein [Photobacterium phosphoreum]|uniref:lipopolysaccharide biosynthesis protein n=1 Tax=Photobacterium phosphoreum TaxID=659 RepID=UPI000D17679A|nr:hypothetical protein [Photobacterium phosphoreum]PTB31628.1 hypothetical protein DAT36_15710 [Photobacterium phosphoreum]
MYILILEKWILFSLVPISIIKNILTVCIPLLPHSIGIFLLIGADRFILTKILGLSTISSYLVILQVSTVFIFIFDAINKGYYPWLFEKLNENNYSIKKKIIILTYFYFILLLCVSVFFFFYGSTLITLIAGENYIVNNNIVGFIFLGQIFGGMYLMVNNYLFYEKEMLLLSKITLSSGIIHLLLISVCSYYWEITGAAFSFCFSKCLQFLLTWFNAYKIADMPWSIQDG